MLHLIRVLPSSEDLYRLLCCLAVAVMTTADCERGFSAMKLIKTPLRNRLLFTNLNNAMLVAIEGPELPLFPFDYAVKKFKLSKNRRVV